MKKSSCLSKSSFESGCDKVSKISQQQQDELIKAALRCLEGRIKYHSNSRSSSEDACNYVRLSLATEANEVFTVFFLDTRFAF